MKIKARVDVKRIETFATAWHRVDKINKKNNNNRNEAKCTWNAIER